MCWKLGAHPVVLLRAMKTFRRWGQVKGSEVTGGMTLKEIVGFQALPCHLLASGPGGEGLGLTTWLTRMYDLATVKNHNSVQHRIAK